MNISLKELIETGCIGPIHLGATRETIEATFGSPDDEGAISQKYHKPLVWKYGDVELHFSPATDCLFLIHLDNFKVPTGGSLALDPWIINNKLTLVEVEAALYQDDIKYKVKKYEYEPNAKCLTTSIGVKLIFIDGNLEAVSYFNNLI